MKQSLLRLLELQAVDKELQSLEDAREHYPAGISSRKKEIESARLSLQEQETRLEELSRTQRQLERDLEAAKASLKEHEGRFAEVTTNKEYDALQLELESCRSRISGHEMQILQTIDAIAETQQEVEAEKQHYAEVLETEQTEIDELERKLLNIQTEVDGVLARRQAYIGSLEGSLLRVYERSRRRRGMRVTAVRKAACGVCFRELPAQQRSNVKRNEQVNYCENCGAILVWDEASS
ncbi:MAG: C4-type zinc ribbon domain-containing protein [Candidatus Latescibacterota bacterium]